MKKPILYRIASVSILVLLFGCASDPKEVKSRDREDFLSSWSSFSTNAMSADAKTIYSAFQGTKIWHYNIETKKSAILAETTGTIFSISADPTGKYLIVGTKEEDDEENSFEILSFNLVSEKFTTLFSKKGKYFDLCKIDNDWKSLTFNYAPLTHSRSGIYFASLTQDGKFENSPQLIVEPHIENNCGFMTKGKKEYVFSRSNGIATSNLLSQQLATKTLNSVSMKARALTEPIESSGLDDGYYALSDINSEFKQVYLFSKDGKATQKTFEDWDVEQVYQSQKTGHIFWVVNQDGYSKLRISDLQFNNVQTMELPFSYFRLAAFSGDDMQILIRGASDTKQFELYKFNWFKKDLLPITSFNRLTIPEQQLSRALPVRIESMDKVKFSALLYKPSPKTDNSIAIIYVHGGPQSQDLPIFDPDTQYWTNQGFTVIQPNFRGSTGYGKSFERAVYHDWGGKHMLDIEATRNYLIHTVGIRKEKIAIIGYSFGGYTASTALVQYPKAYCASVSGLGIHNLLTFIEQVTGSSTDSITERYGSLITDREKLIANSAYYNAEKIKTPLLLVYGEKDRIVLKNQTEELVTKLESLKIPFERTVYENEGHGFSRYYNYMFSMKDSTNFILKHCQ